MKLMNNSLFSSKMLLYVFALMINAVNTSDMNVVYWCSFSIMIELFGHYFGVSNNCTGQAIFQKSINAQGCHSMVSTVLINAHGRIFLGNRKTSVWLLESTYLLIFSIKHAVQSYSFFPPTYMYIFSSKYMKTNVPTPRLFSPPRLLENSEYESFSSLTLSYMN